VTTVSTVTLSDADNGGRIEVRVGDAIAVRLPDNPSTGYRWELAPVDDEHLVVEDESYVAADGRVVGSGGTAIWALRARRRGTAAIEGKRWRPWDGERSVIQRFAVEVEVKDREDTADPGS
jgi:inhibitor of cysteine peptidase